LRVERGQLREQVGDALLPRSAVVTAGVDGDGAPRADTCTSNRFSMRRRLSVERPRQGFDRLAVQAVVFIRWPSGLS
jgi:hypothetical protein